MKILYIKRSYIAEDFINRSKKLPPFEKDDEIYFVYFYSRRDGFMERGGYTALNPQDLTALSLVAEIDVKEYELIRTLYTDR